MNYDKLKSKEPQRLELEVEGSIAFIEYKFVPGTLFLTHTEVPSAIEAKGIGTALVEKVLQYAKRNNFKKVPIWDFARSYFEEHKEWNDIVAPNAERFIHKH